MPEIRNPERDRRPSEAFKAWLSARSESCHGAGLAISGIVPSYSPEGTVFPNPVGFPVVYLL